MAFECKIAADSLAPCGARLTTYIVTYPRAIHSEIMTHRILSKSSASSRAIPTPKLIERVIHDPWIPEYIGKNQKGMQATEMLTDVAQVVAIKEWLQLRDQAVEAAESLVSLGVHKQIANRILEPWMWITVIISGTDWDNFFGLRTHEAAEPHFQHIARMMRDAQAVSVPRPLSERVWHMPLVFEEDYPLAEEYVKAALLAQGKPLPQSNIHIYRLALDLLVKVSVGRCARVSYLNHEGKRDLQADIDLHDRLMVQRPLHAAPAEHVAQAMDWPPGFRLDTFSRPQHVRAVLAERLNLLSEGKPQLDTHPISIPELAEVVMRMTSGNYMGFAQYRKTLPDENIGGMMP